VREGETDWTCVDVEIDEGESDDGAAEACEGVAVQCCCCYAVPSRRLCELRVRVGGRRRCRCRWWGPRLALLFFGRAAGQAETEIAIQGIRRVDHLPLAMAGDGEWSDEESLLTSTHRIRLISSRL
jgi:hypothetical protein